MAATEVRPQHLNWRRRWAALLIDRAVRRVPTALQARMHEEWSAELEAIPGTLSRLRYAASLALRRRRARGDITTSLTDALILAAWSGIAGAVGILLVEVWWLPREELWPQGLVLLFTTVAVVAMQRRRSRLRRR